MIGASAVNGLVSQILHIGMMPMIRPDYWRDRFGGRSLLIWPGQPRAAEPFPRASVHATSDSPCSGATQNKRGGVE